MVKDMYWLQTPGSIIGHVEANRFYWHEASAGVRERCLEGAAIVVATDNDGRVYTGDDLWLLLGEFLWIRTEAEAFA